MFFGRFILSAAIVLSGTSSAFALVDSTDPSADNSLSLDLSYLSGLRVLKKAVDTPPSIRTTWIVFNLLADIETSTLLPNELHSCVGYEACIVETSSTADSNPIVTKAIPLSGSVKNLHESGRMPEFDFENSTWSSDYDNTPSLSVKLKCGVDVDSTIKSEIRYDQSLAVSSNFDELDSFYLHDTNVVIYMQTNLSCPDTTLYVYQNSSSVAWSVVKYILIAVLIAAAAYFAATAYVNYQNGATGVDLLPSSQAVLDIPYVARDFARKVGSGFSQTDSSRDGYAVF
ncbi:autophagy-related protein 27 [Lipomyces oligophaga]|uniref:autophagy-related protein 27 n=1 Tax=Lipomyces oligophaga TaxID=45792 RepID=UPI0034CDC265